MLMEINVFKICRNFSYRKTLKTGAITLTIVYDPETKKILTPDRKNRSRSGAHGDDIYCLDKDQWNRVYVITLYQSNSGKRDISFSENVPTSLIEKLTIAWLYENTIVDDIIRLLKVI
jgi:hypothetical protein